MASTTKKRKRPTKDATLVSTEGKPLTKKHCPCTYVDGINGEKIITIKVPGNMDAGASSSMSKEPVTRRTQAVNSKATPRSNKGQPPSVPELRTPITRSKKWELLSMQEPSTLNVLHNRQDPPSVPFARKWSQNDELRILRGFLEHQELHDKQIDWAVLYGKITRDGSFDNQDAGIPEFKDKVHKLLRPCKEMVPKADDHKIELLRIACNILQKYVSNERSKDHASNAHAHGADVDADIDAAAAAAHNNSHAHGLAAALGDHAGVVASPDVPPAPAAPLDAHAGMGASPDDSPAPASPLIAHAGTGASPDALLGASATVGMPLPVKRAMSSPAALARVSPAAPARASPAAPAHPMLLPSGSTATSCDNSRDEDKPSQWLRVVLWWGSRVAVLVAFAAFMSPGWRKGGYKEFMELGGLVP